MRLHGTVRIALLALAAITFFGILFAQENAAGSRSAISPHGANSASTNSSGLDLASMFRNSRLKINQEKVHPVDGNDAVRVAWGIWVPEVAGNDLIEPEQVSITCSAYNKSCAVLRTRLEVRPWGVELEGPDETDFKVISWDAQGLFAIYGPDRVDKCQRSTLAMSFASGEISLSDIPTHVKGCEVFVITNSYRLIQGQYYVDTTPKNNGSKFF